MKKIEPSFKSIKTHYDGGDDTLGDVDALTKYCLGKLAAKAKDNPLVVCGGKTYRGFSTSSAESRPYCTALFISDPAEFSKAWRSVLGSVSPRDHLIQSPTLHVDRALYTTLMAFSMCYDLWKKESRKTPGTYLEIIVGSLMAQLLPDHKRGKHVAIPGGLEGVSTDIVLEDKGPNKRHLVIPAKITTRERIVQAFAQQRILESVFGMGRYRSVLVCISEMSLSNGGGEVCVPGTIRLYQKHLASLTAIYYSDPPQRYLAADVTSIVPVAGLGQLFTVDLPTLLA